MYSSAAIPARSCPGTGEQRCCAAAAGQESGLTEEESEAELCQGKGNASDQCSPRANSWAPNGGRHCHSCKQPHGPGEQCVCTHVTVTHPLILLKNHSCMLKRNTEEERNDEWQLILRITCVTISGELLVTPACNRATSGCCRSINDYLFIEKI